MNKLTIIGNLTADPTISKTNNGQSVCNFNVAVNRKKGEGADYFRVSAWGKTGDICMAYLGKGKKVCVTGPVSCRAYMDRDGQPKASINVMADEVELLTPKNAAPSDPVTIDQMPDAAGDTMAQGDDYNDLPF